MERIIEIDEYGFPLVDSCAEEIKYTARPGQKWIIPYSRLDCGCTNDRHVYSNPDGTVECEQMIDLIHDGPSNSDYPRASSAEARGESNPRGACDHWFCCDCCDEMGRNEVKECPVCGENWIFGKWVSSRYEYWEEERRQEEEEEEEDRGRRLEMLLS